MQKQMVSIATTILENSQNASLLRVTIKCVARTITPERNNTQHLNCTFQVTAPLCKAHRKHNSQFHARSANVSLLLAELMLANYGRWCSLSS